ncbi:MAG TPA: HNH endonuclease [Blastocatellia bacterium]|nr:HNH endonuclease [Blastocatellia bacterium]
MDREPDPVPDLVKQTVELVLGGKPAEARAVWARIDTERLVSERKMALRVRHARVFRAAIWKQEPQSGRSAGVLRGRRVAVSPSSRLAIFRRDHFVCRYAHCRRRTLYAPVLRALSGLFRDLISYQSNWRPVEEHILYWTYATSLEHAISFPNGGTSNPENLITACYQCNDTKNMLDASELGWEVARVEDMEWDGLSGYLPELLAATGRNRWRSG